MEIAALFAQYGLLAVFVVVLLEQIGLPVPAMPVLLVAGAAAAGNALAGVFALLIAIVASTIGDLAWFIAGRKFGFSILRTMCRISLSPDSCVRQTESTFEKRGVATLVIAKFVPGLATLAPPISGALGVRLSSFLIFNGAGAALWAGTGLAIGVLLHGQIDSIMAALDRLGYFVLVALGAALAAYVAWRAWRRYAFAKQMRMARISVDELQSMIERGEEPVILDARSNIHRRLHGLRIPGAQSVDFNVIENTLDKLPRDRDVIVYCACPNDATAVTLARRLHGNGIVRVRPLAGGIDAWAEAGHQLEGVTD
jgi:membrane protein DedA with SNARE-associated domain/rhodanese-related sulfurtransferase